MVLLILQIKFDELKNKLEIENFTGTTKIAIEQDFYASIYLSNMIVLIYNEYWALHKYDSIYLFYPYGIWGK